MLSERFSSLPGLSVGSGDNVLVPPSQGGHRQATCPGGHPGEKPGAMSHPKVQDRSGWDRAGVKS